MADNQATIDAMAKQGFHFGALRSKRHPSTKSFVFGSKGKVEMVDLEKSLDALERALVFIRNVSREGKQILFVGSKTEARDEIKHIADSIHQPYVNLRWIGGTLTNSDEIKKRIDRYLDLSDQEVKGELSKYTKKERLLLGREMLDLERLFGGILEMKVMPGALFVVDSKKEFIAVAEARRMHIPVIALAGTDCDIDVVDYPIVGNDKSAPTIAHVLSRVAAAYKEGKAPAVAA